MRLQMLYFGALREALGVQQEQLSVPAGSTVADVLVRLSGRGGAWAKACAPDGSVRTAIDQRFARLSDKPGDGSEVALFPPVTGG